MDFSLDLKLVVNIVNSNNNSSTDFESIISYCRQLLSIRFTNFKVEFNQRQTNEVIHELP